MLSVVTFLYRGYRASLYRPRNVLALKAMIAAHLTIPHRFICVSDQDIEGIDTYPAWPAPEVKGVPKGRYNNYRQLGIFGVSEELGDRLLVMDLDLLIRRNIDSLITDDDFRILKGGVSPYNSSIYLLRSGCHRHVWEGFEPDRAEQIIKGHGWIGSDQGWISHAIPDAPTWDRSDGIVHAKVNDRSARVINFSGQIKPWEPACRVKWPWMYEEYMSYLQETATP